ncbi:hypothetical protein GCM10010982_13330 [Bowmanella pacifica]|uniref:site-specific DNA-methyltransferase (adenine-specific) n=1 Tax=Bowmanella pacifica TaxID=502051 RepID=A0A918DHG1_9ALTE|nr:hypothetical protein GCM10010982_13330 [Bowmanella pacifica]
MVLDSFSGGGSIPLESIRLGLPTYASDLNPVAATALKLALELIPAGGKELARKMKRDLADFQNVADEIGRKHFGAADSLAYMWCRTYECPNCHADVPLLPNKWLSKKKNLRAVKLITSENHISFEIFEPKSKLEIEYASIGTISTKTAKCPCCSFEVPTSNLQELGKAGGIGDILYAKLSIDSDGNKLYESPTVDDLNAFNSSDIDRNLEHLVNCLDIPLDLNGIRHLWAIQYGVSTVSSLFSNRQKNVLLELVNAVLLMKEKIRKSSKSEQEYQARYLMLVVSLNRIMVYNNKHSWWQANGEFPASIFVRQAISMVWSYVEVPIHTKFAGGWASSVKWLNKIIDHISNIDTTAVVSKLDAANLDLNDKSVDIVVIDPPYFDSITYAYLSDFFYSWMKPLLSDELPNWFQEKSTPKSAELIVDRKHKLSPSPKDSNFFEEKMTACLMEKHRVLKDDGQLILMYGHKKIEAWIHLFEAIKRSKFTPVSSWPIHSERKSKFQHSKVDALATSCILVLNKIDASSSSKKISAKEFKLKFSEVTAEAIKSAQKLSVSGGDLFMAILAPCLALYFSHDIEQTDSDLYSMQDFISDLELESAKVYA